MPIIVFQTEGNEEYRIHAMPGENLWQLAQKAGVVMDAPCSGGGTCGKCRVQLCAGTVHRAKNGKLTKEEHDAGWVLACQATVESDATLFVPSLASAFQGGIRTTDLSRPKELETYQSAMQEIFASGLAFGTQDAQRGNYGIAIDLGTTTVTIALLQLQSGKICAKASAGNAQMQYGADVINRIIQSARPGGKEKLQKAIVEQTLNPTIERLCQEAQIDPQEIIRCVIAGNTTMEHLLVGADAQTIRLEPYEPEFLELFGVKAQDIGLQIYPQTELIFAPNVGSYVGGDITAGTLTTMLWNQEKMTLLIDLGTNGELVYGNADFTLCCACSAGPAFEGGDIGCGMRAMDGAIESCSIDMDTMEPTFAVIGSEGTRPLGLCGSGLIDTVSELFRCKIISPKGKFIRDGERIKRDEYGASYVLAFAEESQTGHDIVLNEVDLDNFIRAKGAIFSAVRSMLHSLDMTEDAIEHLFISGGIGSGIDIPKAIAIGMLPSIPIERFSYIGNSSLTGACAMLLSDAVTQKVFELGRNMTYLELSVYPGYMDEFIAACFIPHTDLSFRPS